MTDVLRHHWYVVLSLILNMDVGDACMKQYTTTMTQRGQVTVPVDVQKLLRIGPRDKVTFMIEGDEVRLTSARERLHAVFGAIEPLDSSHPSDFDEQISEAKEERAERSEAKRRAS